MDFEWQDSTDVVSSFASFLQASCFQENIDRKLIRADTEMKELFVSKLGVVY